MKSQGKEVKVGDLVRSGNITIKVDKIENGTQKNGTETVTFYGNVERNMGRGYKKKKFYGELKVKSDTFLTIY